MRKDRDPFKAGLFIVISIVLIIGVIIAIKGAGLFIEPLQTRRARFELKDDVGGLRAGDDVRVGGLKVGIVRSRDIVEAEGPTTQPHIEIDFQMPRRLILREGARIGVQNTVTGTSWLNFDSLGTGAELPEDVVLQGRAGSMTLIVSAMNELAPQLSQIVQDVRQVTLPKVNNTLDSTSGLAQDIQGRLHEAIERYNTAADRAAELLAHLNDVFGQGKGDLRTTLANLNAATTTVKEKLPPLMEKVDVALTQVNENLDRARTALADLSTTLENARALSGDARSLLTRNRTRIDEMVVSAKQASDNLKFATAEIRRSPWRLLYKPRPNEMANLNLFDAARAFADGANNMADAATALRDALDDPAANPELIEKLVESLDQSFGQFQTVESELWQRVKE